MRPQIIISRPPVPFRLKHLVASEAFAGDAVALARLNRDLVVKIREICEGETFFEIDAVRDKIDSVAAQQEGLTSSAVLSALAHLPELYDEFDEHPKDFKRLLFEALGEAPLDPGIDKDDLSTHLTALAIPTKSMERQWKANRVARMVGQPLESFDIATDVRPVYNDDRDSIEGVVVVTTAVIKSGESEMTLHLTSGDLEKLSRKITEAIQKADVASARAESAQLAVAVAEEEW